MRSRAGYSVYDGRDVYGGPVYTISRGEVVVEDGEVTARRGQRALGAPGPDEWDVILMEIAIAARSGESEGRGWRRTRERHRYG